MIQRFLAPLCLLLGTLLSPALSGHERGESYLFLEFLEDSIRGRVEIRASDLTEKLNIDVLHEGSISEQKLLATGPQAIAYIAQHLSIAPAEGEAYKIEFQTPKLFEPEGGWAQYEFTISAKPVPDFLDIEFTMLLEQDKMHRNLVITEKGVWPSEDYEMNMAMVYSSSNSEQTLDVVNPPTVQTPMSMIWQGVLHIWIGIDHILFLVALALPIVLTKREDKWEPATGLWHTLLSLLKIVTVFTIAHSITLALASLEIIQLSSRLVESVIALSIALVALNNVLGRTVRASVLVTFLLGLFHGLGFASVMADLPFRIFELKEFLKIIVAFNVGVELGQLAILMVLFPIIYALRKSSLYRPVVLRGGSVVLILIAGYWFVERAFAL